MEKVRPLYFLQLFEFKLWKCPYFFHSGSYKQMRAMLWFLGHEHEHLLGDVHHAVHGGDHVNCFLHRTSYYDLGSVFGQKKILDPKCTVCTVRTVLYITVQYCAVHLYSIPKSKLGQYKVISFWSLKIRPAVQ